MDSADIILQIYARQVATRMRSNTTTSTSELQAYGNLYFPKQRFLGIFPADIAPKRPPHGAFYIQNTLRSDSEDRSGCITLHFLATLTTKQSIQWTYSRIQSNDMVLAGIKLTTSVLTFGVVHTTHSAQHVTCAPTARASATSVHKVERDVLVVAVLDSREVHRLVVELDHGAHVDLLTVRPAVDEGVLVVSQLLDMLVVVESALHREEHLFDVATRTNSPAADGCHWIPEPSVSSTCARSSSA
eukprot:COSAG06_NODE_6851_length_2746_cov_2.120136_2_plen_244_part_00